MVYEEDEYLMLSGLQHFLFCRRQWALIHIEQQWAENVLTSEGRVMHKNAHDGELKTRRGDVLTVRGLSIHSAKLGISGQCDVVEFRQTADGISLENEQGLWLPYPVEYKRGKAKTDDCDAAQLCAQAMCLEEMLCCHIPKGAIFYGEPRRRTEVMFSDELRKVVTNSIDEMHQLYVRGYTPKTTAKKGCANCSIKDICLPKLLHNLSVTDYLKGAL